jgi:hypothetical protein
VVFVYRAAIVALATFVSGLVGFGLHWALPAAYVDESKGMLGSVVGLVASLLSLVLSLLIWTGHGVFTAQQSQLASIGRAVVRLDFVLRGYGAETAPARTILREHVGCVRALLWENVNARRFIYYGDLPQEVHHMRALLASFHPANDQQRHDLETARDLFDTAVEMQLTIVRTLVNRVPNLLLNVVLGWSCVLFFGFGLLSDFDALTVVLAGLGSICVGSAVFLILELSDPYSGLFIMPREGFDTLIRALTRRAEIGAGSES